MEQQFTNKQILGRLQAEFKGWRVEPSRRGDAIEVTAPDGRTFRVRFDEVRSPLALQRFVQNVRQGRR